ncbi:MAG: hypothetical protein Q7T97_10660 [Burkholderiaceae bacterium]|nr:hypothetical protein [Burkholderiaceae bacterium]
MIFRILSHLPTALRSRWARYRSKLRHDNDAGKLLILVFSKDRPLQMDLLLRTLSVNVSQTPNVHIIYRASDNNYRTEYSRVFAENSALNIVPHEEREFREDLLRICRASDCGSVMFLVDDIAFIRPVDLNEIATLSRQGHIVSIRLGLNITRAQTENGAARRKPPLTPVDGMASRFLTWAWHKAEPGHWAMPTALDGNVLPLPELIPVLESTSFKAPNSLEAAIGQYRFLFKYAAGVCYDLPRIVNFPLNSVKAEDFNFPHMGMSVDDMLTIYKNGGRLDISNFPYTEHDSCHMEWIPQLAFAGNEHAHSTSHEGEKFT